MQSPPFSCSTHKQWRRRKRQARQVLVRQGSLSSAQHLLLFCPLPIFDFSRSSPRSFLLYHQRKGMSCKTPRNNCPTRIEGHYLPFFVCAANHIVTTANGMKTKE